MFGLKVTGYRTSGVANWHQVLAQLTNGHCSSLTQLVHSFSSPPLLSGQQRMAQPGSFLGSSGQQSVSFLHSGQMLARQIDLAVHNLTCAKAVAFALLQQAVRPRRHRDHDNEYSGCRIYRDLHDPMRAVQENVRQRTSGPSSRCSGAREKSKNVRKEKHDGN